MLSEVQQENPNAGSSNARKSTLFNEGSSAIGNSQEGSAKDWNYIRVEGLGIFPGLVCPHYDRIQSNGVPRMFDFDKMMSRHSLELGLGIDHFAALEINGEDFRILSIPGVAGSVPHVEGEEELLNIPMVPGAWIKYVDEDGNVQSKACPSSGKIEDLLQALVDPSKHIWHDGRVEICRQQNPGPSMD
jgi:dipeptidase E